MDKLKIPTGLVVFLFFFSIYTFTMSGVIEYGDEIEKYRVAQSIVERGELSFRPTAMRNISGVGGKTFSIYELGQTVLEVPLYALGKSLDHFFPAPDANQVEMLVVGLLNPLLSALTCVVLFKTAGALGFKHRTALTLTGVYGLATIALPYARGYTREPLLTLTLLLSLYAVIQFQNTRARGWLLAGGLAVGYLVFSKFIHAMIAPFLLAYIAYVIAQTHRRAGRTAEIAKAFGVFLLPAFVFFVAQSVYAAARFGTIFIGIAGTKINPVEWIVMLIGESKPVEALIGLLFSPDKSVFLYSPPAILALIALPRWYRQQKMPALLFIGILAIEFVAVIVRPDWDGGTWWGPRYLVQIVPLMILPLGVLLQADAREKWRAVVAFFFALGVGAQMLGAFSNDREYFDVTDTWTTVANQMDFLRYGAMDSLVFYLVPDAFPFRLNPFGITLIVSAVLTGAWLARSARRGETGGSRWGVALAAFILILELSAFVVWIVAPYPRVQAAEGNTRLVAGNHLRAAGRICDAAGMYRLALEKGATDQAEIIARLNEIDARAAGGGIAADDLTRQIELSGEASITTDHAIAITPEGAVKISAAPGKEVIATAISTPLDARANTAYEISGWMRTLGIYGRGYAAVTIFEDDGDQKAGRDTDIVLMDETQGWQRVRKRITTLPTTKRLFIKTSLWKTYGTVWLDDVRFAPSDAGAATLCK